MKVALHLSHARSSARGRGMGECRNDADYIYFELTFAELIVVDGDKIDMSREEPYYISI